MTLAGVYGFWKYVSKLERRETRRYLEMFYILKFRELVHAVVNFFLLTIYEIKFCCNTLERYIMLFHQD